MANDDELQKVLRLIPDAPSGTRVNVKEAPMMLLPSELRVLKEAILASSNAIYTPSALPAIGPEPFPDETKDGFVYCGKCGQLTHAASKLPT